MENYEVEANELGGHKGSCAGWGTLSLLQVTALSRLQQEHAYLACAACVAQMGANSLSTYCTILSEQQHESVNLHTEYGAWMRRVDTLVNIHTTSA